MKLLTSLFVPGQSAPTYFVTFVTFEMFYAKLIFCFPMFDCFGQGLQGAALIYSGVKFTHNQLNTEAEITKLHMAILLTIMDNIMPKFFIPASFQPQ